MKRKIGVAALLALIATGGFASAASAECTAVLIKFDADAFAYETNYTTASFNSAAGSQLSVVGIVSQFSGALSNIVATDPNNEYTFYWTNLTSNGTVFTPAINRYQTSYAGGDFFIYQGSPRNAPTSAGGMPPNPPNAQVPVLFVDGNLILQGTMTGFMTTITRLAAGPPAQYATVFRCDYNFTGPIGGIYYNQVQGSGPCILGGAWCAARPTGNENGLCTLAAGYSSHPNGKWDGPAVTAIPSSTWGALKQLYR